MKKLFLLLAALITTFAVMAQNQTVNGTVTSADGEPLIGATVMGVGTQMGTATDVDGNFTLTLPATVKKLQGSYVGMTTKDGNITPGQKMNIVLDGTNMLDEVITVAYGTAKKSAFTGSATVIDAAEIEQSQVTNALNALQGKAAGTQIFNQSGQPGSGPSSIVIRGISSLNAGNDPLIVLDGVPFGGSITNINTSDIESMTILKDAASNALYGARGANGVILITTKKAKSGSNAIVTLDAKWGQNSRAVQDYNTIQDPRLYFETYYGSLYNYFTNERGMSPTQAWQTANANLINSSDYGLGYQPFSYPTNEYFIGRNGKVNPLATPGNVVSYNGQDYFITPDNWLDETYTKSLRQEYNVSVSNSTQSTNFYASIGYLKNEGIIANTDYERFTGRLNADSQLKSWLKVGANMAYAHTNNNAMGADGSATAVNNPLAIATSIAPIYPMYIRDGKGNIMTNADGMILYDYGQGQNAGLSRPNGASFGSNGVSDVLYNTNNTEGNSVNATGYAEVRFLKDFKFTTNNTVYVNEYRGTAVSNPLTVNNLNDGGRVIKEHQRYMTYTYQQLLNWNRKFGLHDVGVLLGHENSWIKTTLLGATRTNMFSPGNHELNGAVIDNSMESYTTSYDNEGFFFRAQYDYDSKYFASASYRRDASSRFHPDHRWGNFWSLGGAWIISKESWFETATWVDLLKIKASYGEQGNDNIGNYRYTNNYTVVNVNGQPSLSASSVKGNPDITWEKNGNFNAGVEFAFFNNRLSGSFETFYRKTSDMLYQKPLAASSGFSNQWENFGDMSNTGIELDLHGRVIETRDFTWDLNFNLTWYKNKVTRLPETNKGNYVEGHYGTASRGFFIAEGLPMYTYYLAQFAGVDQETGMPLFWKNVYKTDENGAVMKDAAGHPIVDSRKKVNYNEEPDQYLCGSAIPKAYGGFGTAFTFKGFDLSVDFTYQIGGKVIDGNYDSYMSAPQSGTRGATFHADVLNAWTPENPSATIPRFQFGDNFQISSDQYLTDASYLSLQNVNFGYTIPKNVCNKIFLQKVRVYFSGENLWLWSKRQGLDPRQFALGGTSIGGGNTYYSAIRTLSGGITVTF
ncbi:TonB-dependent receptor [uncultured Duncaniella sp.]|uniref:SusC/RagA family TonB-linked outer membrane protein n=1 Tax=uncultured Duncaniella sp. TaxID=2768039 RepID=UPI00272B1A33|nr:TonB-dependent receptor [uncultured Duncaniella sp.]